MTCYAFGWGKNGQLGMDCPVNCTNPTHVVGLKAREVCGVAAGSRCTAAVTSSGQVYTWGKGDEGQLGHDATEEGLLAPRMVEELSSVKVTQVSCRGSHMAALDSSGRIWTWGANKEGQLGYSSQNPQEGKLGSATPEIVKALQHHTITRVCCGREFTVAISAAGKLYTWGNGHDGQLGYSRALMSAMPRQVREIRDALLVSCGSRHVLVLTASGLYSWGWNAYGQVGNGGMKEVTSPCLLSLQQVTSISCGYRHSCAVSQSTAFTWGWGGHGQLGHGNKRNLSEPSAVLALHGDVKDVACGGAHTLFILDSEAASEKGSIYACGRNDDGQLGVGTTDEADLPVAVPLQGNIKCCSLGWAHSVVVTEGPAEVTINRPASTELVSFAEAARHSVARGDLDAFFAFFMNCLLQLMVIRQLCSKMLGGSDQAVQIVLQKVLPGVGATMVCGHSLFVWQGLSQAVKSGRFDWTAQPHGINSLTLFPFLQLIIYPVLLASSDPEEAWAAAVFANFMLAWFELLVCAPLAYTVKAWIPQASLFAALAGTGITFLTLNFVFNIFMHPVTSLLPLAIILMSFSAEIRLPAGLPGGFVSLLLGVLLGWVAERFQLQPPSQPPPMDTPELALPWFQHHAIVLGARHYGQVLSVVVPLSLLNLVNNLAAVESANVTQDEYSVSQSLALDAVADIVGSLLGNPFPTSIFIGQPAYKKMGARQGYLLLNAAVVFLIVGSSSVSLFLRYIPLEAVETMLVWIGVIITAQAFTSTTRIAAGAVAMGMIPGLCAWAVNFLQSVLMQTETTSIEQLIEQRPELCLPGLLAVSAGYLFVSIILASVYAHVEERRFQNAAQWAFIGAALSSIGMIHSFKVDGNNVLSDAGFLHSEKSKAFTATYLAMGVLFYVTFKVQELTEDAAGYEWMWWRDSKANSDAFSDSSTDVNTPLLDRDSK
eukprot:TRINITY_DN28041_c0_g1_i1.p1 TRINITY_DN28041_c0_g1~~TRINITY_DN28041_c0_g1_i1.p1  ORF type:complete len:940 (-),score=156.95 TRINITY_DN28041_c0_g1_i1:27-2846(-)